MDVFEGKIEEQPNMAVPEGIEHHPTRPPDLDHLMQPEEPQGVAGGGLADPRRTGEVTDAQFPTFEKRDQQPEPAGITEEGKRVGQLGELDVVGKALTDGLDPIGVDPLDGALIHRLNVGHATPHSPHI